MRCSKLIVVDVLPVSRKKWEALWVSWQGNLMSWLIPIVPSFGRLRQEFKARLGYNVRLCHNNNYNKRQNRKSRSEKPLSGV